MSTSSVSSSTTSAAQTGYQLTSLGNGASQQITGLASGLNTDQIVTEMMAIYQQPVTRLQNQVSGLHAQNSALTSIQTALQTLANDAQALGRSSLFNPSQSVTSSNAAISASSTSGAPIGGYQVSVTQLANSAQATYQFDSTNADTVTLTLPDTTQQTVAITAGESIQDFVNSINSNSSLSVYAAATDSSHVVFSDRNTGAGTISDGVATTSPLVQITSAATGLAYVSNVPGQDANYTIGNSGTLTSHSNTVTSAIPGVSLTFNSLTGSAPATINVGPPAANQASITDAVNAFVTQYNTVIGQIQTQLSTPPSASDPTVGSLYDDPDLASLLMSMRSSIYTNHSSTPGLTNLEAIGISTGATTGTGAVSQSALSGDLSVNATELTSALQSNPAAVQSLLRSWSLNFSFMVNNEAAPGGTIDQRIQGDDNQVSSLQKQISTMQASLAEKQSQLVNQFAAMEAALSGNQSTATWLTGQIAQLPGA